MLQIKAMNSIPITRESPGKWAIKAGARGLRDDILVSKSFHMSSRKTKGILSLPSSKR
jgi:hypothetical protein